MLRWHPEPASNAFGAPAAGTSPQCNSPIRSTYCHRLVLTRMIRFLSFHTDRRSNLGTPLRTRGFFG